MGAHLVAERVESAPHEQAIRLYANGRDGGKLTKKDLVTIEADDVLKSRVFEGGVYQERESEDDTRSAGD
ncbi:MAG: hypothetical protein H0V97_07015 [Actinobacteria bacterium]|nr:hypothetical protein [Actinomycetota bacterium]